MKKMNTKHRKSNKKTILLLGHLPPPVMGPSLATKIILESSLTNEFNISNLNTSVHMNLNQLGKITFRSVIKTFGLYIKFIKLLNSKKFDLVLIPISQTLIGFIKDSFFILIAKKFKLKVLIQLRGSSFNQFIKNYIIKLYVINILKKTFGVIVLHNNYKNIFREYFPLDRIYSVTNGFDLDFIFSRKPSKCVNILFLSNLLKSKGILNVLDAFKISYKVKKNISLSLVGDCNDISIKNKIKVMSERYPVKYYGLADEKQKYKYFEKANIFVFPPIAPEGLPWSVIEALAAGLPVIITKEGNGCNLVSNGKNGFIVDTITQISNKMIELANNIELRKIMSKESKNIYCERFTEKQMVEQYQRVFDLVISNLSLNQNE